jgi:phosphohistidine phosphatase
MKLYIIRHAQAVELGAPKATSDFDRYLTEHGVATAAKLADVLKQQGVKFDAILSSPYIRAVQTAQPLMELAHVPMLTMIDELGCGKGKPREIAGLLHEMNQHVVAVVGHSPDLDELVGWLIGANDNGIHMAKGSVAKLNTNGEVRKGGCTLCWQVTPKFYFPQPPAIEEIKE